jgi:hypothetical protein
MRHPFEKREEPVRLEMEHDKYKNEVEIVIGRFMKKSMVLPHEESIAGPRGFIHDVHKEKRPEESPKAILLLSQDALEGIDPLTVYQIERLASGEIRIRPVGRSSLPEDAIGKPIDTLIDHYTPCLTKQETEFNEQAGMTCCQYVMTNKIVEDPKSFMVTDDTVNYRGQVNDIISKDKCPVCGRQIIFHKFDYYLDGDKFPESIQGKANFSTDREKFKIAVKKKYIDKAKWMAKAQDLMSKHEAAQKEMRHEEDK